MGVSVTGAPTNDEVKAGMDGRRDLFARRYAAGLAKTPTLAGSASVRLEIGKSGEVMSVKYPISFAPK